jgi:hypothetical protein
LEFERESRNAALAEKLIDAYRDIVELDDTNRQLRRENVETANHDRRAEATT